ncbi:alpha/beta fold hydrolase [Catenovulum maritimum]|uniref:S9 family peptidase n=1 Tax=Catenovulum maritimum TaxID=1513271 RepID=UPI00097C94AB|nr:alpha/beta fold hydrolase [Catenovulum maritimum]
MQKLFCLILFLSSMGIAHATVSDPQIYGALKSVSLMSLSPSGERIAYRTTDGNKDLVVVMDIKNNKFIGGINAEEVNPQKIHFVTEDKVIFVASQYKSLPGFIGKHHVSTAFVYDIENKKLRQLLVPGDRIYTGQTNLGTIVGISPDQKYAYMPAYVGENQDMPNFNLMKIKLTSKAKPTNYALGLNSVIDYFVDADGGLLARERYENDGGKHVIEARKNDEWVEIFSEKVPYRYKSFVGVTPDRKSLVMLTKSNKTRRTAYYTMSLSDGKISSPIFEHKNKGVESVITDINRVVAGVRFSGFKPSYSFFDKELDKKINNIVNSMPQYSFRITDYDDNWNNIIFYLEGEGLSGDYLLSSKGGFSRLAGARKHIAGSEVAQVIEYEYTARDGLKIPTLLTYPKSVKAQSGQPKLPAIMLPHGGPESYDRFGFDWLAQYFAKKGFLVIQPQFRGSSGFGADHTLAGYGEWGKKMQHDLTDAVLHLTQTGDIDPDKVCIVGASYGGYAALAGAAFTPEIYKCVISINGVSDLEEMMDTEEEQYSSNHWVVRYWNDVIADGPAGDKLLSDISPINHVEKINAPVLLIHGEHDTVVPYKQSYYMHDELDDADKQVTLVRLNDEDHYLSSDVTRKSALEAIEKFLKKHML